MGVKQMNGYNVFKNGNFVTFIKGRSKVARRGFVRRFIISTHMGEWRRTLTVNPRNIKKTAYEYEYTTTIGVYLTFQPAIES